MKEFEKRVFNVIKDFDLITNGDRIVVGFSAGPDSTALINTLYTINQETSLHFELIACHVNHGIRENAKLDEEYAIDYCNKRNIKLEVLHVDVPKKAKEMKRGLEDTGRILRYDFFKEIANKYNTNKIAIAHNKKDKAETIIMNALRGCGLTGLRGIEEKQIQNGFIYIRPIIEESREEIEKYLKEENIIPRIDESNFDNTYTRNNIRNVVIPYVEKEFNPSFVDGIIRMSQIIKEDDEYIEKQVNEAFNSIILLSTENQIELDLKRFNKLDYAIEKRILLKSIELLFGTTQGIELVHVNDMVKLCNNNIGNKYLTPNKYTQIVIKNKKIIINRLK